MFVVSESISRVVVLLSELVGGLNVLHNICIHFELFPTDVTQSLTVSALLHCILGKNVQICAKKLI